MAEGLVNHFLGEAWGAHSAGAQPSGYVHPLAVQAMLELGINISGHRSKSTDELRDTHFDLVVWLRGGRVVHIGFPDPAKATGSHIEQLDVFRQVRDAIREQVLEYLEGELYS
jgi:arsenate reductase